MANNRELGMQTEKDFLPLITEFFPFATRTRVGETGSDIAPATVGGRFLEITRANWDVMSLKLEQSRQAAAARGGGDYCVLKKTPGHGGKPPQYYYVADARQALGQAAELDRLRAAAPSITEAFDSGYDRGYRAALASLAEGKG